MDIKFGPKSKVCIKWSVLPVDYSHDKEKELISAFAKAHGISKENISVDPRFIMLDNDGNESEFSNDIITDIQDPKFQQKLFGEWLKMNNVENFDMEFILDIDKMINSQINYDAYEKHKRYTIKWIKWSNFMSYGPDNFFDFTTLKKLTLLTSEPANQGGKTTFCLDLIRFLLFGKVTSRENPGDWVLMKLFNRHLPEETEVYVEGCINLDGEDYIIKRSVTRPALKKRSERSKATSSVEYFHLVNGEYIEMFDPDDEGVENEKGSTVTETNKIIKEAIGNEKDFDLMICVDADNLKSLISLKDTERGRLIARWIGLLPLEEKESIAKETFNTMVKPKLLSVRYNKDELVERNNEYAKENEYLKKEIEKATEKREASDKRITELNKTKETLIMSKSKIDESLTKIDVTTLQATIDNIIEEGKNKRAEKQRNEDRLKEIGKIEFDEKSYKDELREHERLSVSISELRNTCHRLQTDISALTKGEFCPTCGAKLKNVDNTEAIKKKNEEYESAKKEGVLTSEKLKESDKRIEELEKTRALYGEYTRLSLIIEKNGVDIENLTARYRENKRTLKDINDNKEAIEKNNVIELNIATNNENILVETKIRNEQQTIIDQSNGSIQSNEKLIKKNDELIKAITDEEKVVESWKLYLMLIGKNGISKIVLRNALPFINGELKRLLNGVCDFDVDVQIDDHNDVTFNMIHDGIVSNLASGSGFEKTAASLALRSVLSKVSSFSKPSIVVFDEILGGVADENYDNMKKLYDRIVNDTGHILQISHLKAISDWHDSAIKVIKTNNISKVVPA